MIISSALLTSQYKDELKNWSKDFLPKELNIKFRRAGRFSIASICGALECIDNFDKKNEMSIYLGSSNGDVQNTKDSQDIVFLQNDFPFPISFINTLNNTPLFFLMQHLNLKNLGMSISSNQFAFEQSLSLALVDLFLNKTIYALIGICDVWFEPKELSFNFLKQENAEFSAWLLLGKNKKNSVDFFDSFEKLVDKIKFKKIKWAYLSPFISEQKQNILKNYLDIKISNAPSTITNQSASIIIYHFQKNRESSCFYIGFDKRFGYSLVCLYNH